LAGWAGEDTCALDRAPLRVQGGAGLVATWSQVGSLLAFYLVWAGLQVAMTMMLDRAAFTVLSKWFSKPPS
jgi:hypothetical protein